MARTGAGRRDRIVVKPRGRSVEEWRIDRRVDVHGRDERDGEGKRTAKQIAAEDVLPPRTTRPGRPSADWYVLPAEERALRRAVFRLALRIAIEIEPRRGAPRLGGLHGRQLLHIIRGAPPWADLVRTTTKHPTDPTRRLLVQVRPERSRRWFVERDAWLANIPLAMIAERNPEFAAGGALPKLSTRFLTNREIAALSIIAGNFPDPYNVASTSAVRKRAAKHYDSARKTFDAEAKAEELTLEERENAAERRDKLKRTPPAVTAGDVFSAEVDAIEAARRDHGIAPTAADQERLGVKERKSRKKSALEGMTPRKESLAVATLTDDEATRIRAIVSDIGIAGAARALDVSRNGLANTLAGRGRRGTVTLIRERLRRWGAR